MRRTITTQQEALRFFQPSSVHHGCVLESSRDQDSTIDDADLMTGCSRLSH
ncbi:MAG: hypothetical protein OXN89_22925 [Bryobacterales bacterium]|nr:hypothetical protein [Bryobacterales bacterium]